MKTSHVKTGDVVVYAGREYVRIGMTRTGKQEFVNSDNTRRLTVRYGAEVDVVRNDMDMFAAVMKADQDKKMAGILKMAELAYGDKFIGNNGKTYVFVKMANTRIHFTDVEGFVAGSMATRYSAKPGFITQKLG